MQISFSKSFIVFFLLSSFFISFVRSQEINPKDIDVSSLSDHKIQKLIKEMKRKGMSEENAISLARAKGMTESQIKILRERIKQVKLKSFDIDEEENLEEKMMLEDSIYSKKTKIDTTVIDARIFGFSFFNNKRLTFEPQVNSAVSPSYLLGSGDKITIDVWGASQQSYSLDVNINGNINIPNLGVVSVGGLSLKQASDKILNKLQIIYSDLKSDKPKTFAAVSVSNVKAINVNVIGEVFAPGTYTISGASTAFNALYLAGGPNVNGSFRNISVIRDNKVIADLDVYDYLINGNSKVNIPVRDGDVILVNPYINRVIIEGEVKRKGIFEAKKGETVSNMIKYAGGFNDKAYRKRLELHRKTERNLSIKDVDADMYNSTLINNGDSLYIGEIINRYSNIVNIKGAVFRPGNYELTEGLKLSQLIKKAEGLRENAFVNRGLITRLSKDFQKQCVGFNPSDVINGKVDYELQRNDSVFISSIDDMQELRTVQIYGEIKKPGIFDYKEGMSLSDLIYEAGGFVEGASNGFIEVARRLSEEEMQVVNPKITKIYQEKVSKNLVVSEKSKSFILYPFDKIFVRKLPGFKNQSVVKISGEIAYAGDYALKSNSERVSTIIKRAGGLGYDAFPQGAMLTREVPLSSKQKRLRKLLMKKDSTLRFDDIDFNIISLDLNEVIKNPGGKDDIFLRDGDELFIPKSMQTVRVSGEVLNPLAVKYSKGKNLKRYIRESGGFSTQAKKSKVYIVYPNGSANDTKNYIFFRKYPKVKPGAQIMVPSKPYKEPMTASAWIAISSGLATLALTIVTITNNLNK